MTPATDDPILGLLADRARVGSQPGRRDDGVRLALAVEGGGMAGAVSAGMCVGLESLGLISCFDAIYGASAGSLNASYTAAGQAGARCSLYPEAAEAGLIDPRRALRGLPPFRLSEIVNSLLLAQPHDRAVLDARPSLHVTATRLRDRQLEVLSNFESVAEVRRAVWASSAVPILAGGVVDLRGERYVDGGLLDSMSYDAALRDGASHVLVLRSRPSGYRFRDYRGPAGRAMQRMLRDAPEPVLELVRERPARYNADASALSSGSLAGRVSQLAPSPGARTVSQFESRPSRLIDGIRLGLWTLCGTLAPYLAPARAPAPTGSAAVAARAVATVWT